MDNTIFIYVTAPPAEAKKIALHLLRKKLIVCANLFPIQSLYRWDGKIKDEPESALILKTTAAHFLKVKQEIMGLHPYKVPCIARIDVNINAAYAQWIQQQLFSSPGE